MFTHSDFTSSPTGSVEFKSKNPDFCLVFRSELIVIKRGLQYANQVDDQFHGIEILTDRRDSAPL